MSKESVRLRKKMLTNGSSSLYLDIYVGGERSYEFLKMYLVPELSDADRQANESTLAEAEGIRAVREVEILRKQVADGKERGRMLSFFDYATHFASRASISKARSLTINSVVRHMRRYAGNDALRLSDIDKSWVVGFKSFLDKHSFKHNTRRQYMTVLRSMLKSAQDDELMDELPLDEVEQIPVEETIPQYLTIDEVQIMSEVPCDNEVVKRAFLFSCLTGIKFKDIKRVTWGQVQRFGNYIRISFSPSRPDEEEQYINVTEEAVPFLGERGDDEDLVFESLPDNKTVNTHLKKWAHRAGITKKMTFHVARHTFATMLLTLRVDPLTVQKLLGHRSLYSTQKYAAAIRGDSKDEPIELPPILTSKH